MRRTPSENTKVIFSINRGKILKGDFFNRNDTLLILHPIYGTMEENVSTNTEIKPTIDELSLIHI